MNTLPKLFVELFTFKPKIYEVSRTVENRTLDLDRMGVTSFTAEKLCEDHCIDFVKSVLTNLNLSNNFITSIPESPSQQWRHLVFLNLSFNQIEEIPDNCGLFQVASKLRNVNLSNNKISRIPELAFSQLRQLKYLDLSNNQISVLPQTIGNLSLTVLNVQDNPISFPSPSIIKQGTRATLEYLRGTIFKDLFKSELYSDVQVSLESDPSCRISAHGIILMERFPLFQAYYERFKEESKYYMDGIFQFVIPNQSQEKLAVIDTMELECLLEYVYLDMFDSARCKEQCERANISFESQLSKLSKIAGMLRLPVLSKLCAAAFSIRNYMPFEQASFNFSRYANSQQFSDLEFLIPKSGAQGEPEFETLYAHKAILVSRSHYFKGMLNGGLVEASQKKIVLEHEVSKHAFQAFIDYLYSTEANTHQTMLERQFPQTFVVKYFMPFVSQSSNTSYDSQAMVNFTMDLCAVSHLFQCEDLKRCCELLLMKHVNEAMVFHLFEFADLYQAYELRGDCFDFIVKHTSLTKWDEFKTVLDESLQKDVNETLARTAAVLQSKPSAGIDPALAQLNAATRGSLSYLKSVL